MRSLHKLTAAILILALLTGMFCVTAFAAGTGTQSDPLQIEYNTMILGFLMNDKLEADDQDGIWYTMKANKAGIMYVEIHCYEDVDFEVEVTAGGYTGRASESNPIITYPVAEGDEITVHKYVKADKSGKIAAATVYTSAIIVAGNTDEPVNMIDSQIKVPVAANSSVTLTEKNNRIKLYGKALVVSGPSEAIKKAVVRFNGKEYTDVDRDGTIELALPGNYESRPPITMINNSGANAVYTFNIVDSAEEGEPVYILGDITNDGNINNEDVVLLLWHTLFPEDYSITGSGDINKDAEINNDDVVLLLWHTLFPEDYPLS